MRNKINQKAFNYVKNELNYESSKIGMSAGNLANFATLGGGVQLGWEFTFPDFLCGFLYASLDSTNQQKMKKI